MSVLIRATRLLGVSAASGAVLVAFAGGAMAVPSPDLDGSFGNGGTATTDYSGTADSGSAVALQRDGKIVVAGTRNSGPDFDGADYAVARYNADGTSTRVSAETAAW